jgi:hypothetical protein
MTIARLRRLERLEARQPRGPVWRDPFPSVMRLWPDLQAVVAGKACWCKLPEPAQPWPDETQPAFELLTREVDAAYRRGSGREFTSLERARGEAISPDSSQPSHLRWNDLKSELPVLIIINF